MKPRCRTVFCFLALLVGVAVFASTTAFGATGSVSGADEVAKLSVLNVEDKVDCTLSYLRVEKEMDVPNDFKSATGFMTEVEARADADGLISTDTSDPNLAANGVIKNVCNTLLTRTVIYQNILVAILDNVDNVSADYCEMWEAFEEIEEPTVQAQDEEYDPVVPDDPEPEPEPEPEPRSGNFIFYGARYEVTDDEVNPEDDVYLMGNGVISFLEPFYAEGVPDAYPPAIAPLLVLEDAEGDAVTALDNIFDSPKVYGGDTGNFYRYAYNTGEALTDPFSATLYENENSEQSDWIAFSYGSDSKGYNNLFVEDGNRSVFVGLIPGDGSADHPGAGIGRNRLPDEGQLDLSLLLGEAVSGDDYLWLYELYELPDEQNDGGQQEMETTDVRAAGFDLTDTFLVFRPDPDGDNKYRIIAGRRDMVVDSFGLDGESTVLDMAIENMMDPNLRDTVDTGEFLPGEFRGEAGEWKDTPTGADFTYWSDGKYEYGLQTVGTDRQYPVNGYRSDSEYIFAQDEGMPYLFSYRNVVDPAYVLGDTSARRINDNGFLAYAVQLEEDIVNREIVRQAQNREDIENAVAGIKTQLGYGDIRARDAAFARMADAQSGRVTKDHNGNWVRSQQYVLRPDDQTVQVLNVSLRGQDASNAAAMSIMNFTTKIAAGHTLPRDLKQLPWDKWLDTQYDGNAHVRYVNTNLFSPVLEEMSVEFMNVVSGVTEDSLMEYRHFGPGGQSALKIDTETLTLNGTSAYDYFVAESPFDEMGPREYEVISTNDGFDYVLGDESPIGVAFYALGDGESPRDLGHSNVGGDVDDIWDALRVNEGGTSPNIDSRVLEIAIDEGKSYFSQPIDVVYIPMSRMLWKDSEQQEQFF